ncbi:hypothetical protein GLP24_06505 [Photobacterium carnosum]|uniref:Wzz/FepE/Etk N-terminal domain-containing protein n=1 Tax=Photobacterium carnosum TaxID=2023717 RepID=UPI001E52FF23|nr:Wzz/FepE/Etk N-terminal domain-containing protein [Photobacterium carnosum]MCD9544496.1 hypothetical protein [Photobacterium carnosum]
MDLSRKQTDEVGCDQMYKVLWRGKNWIMLSASFFTLIGWYYCLSIKPLWNASEYVYFTDNNHVVYGKNKNNQNFIETYYSNKETNVLKDITSNEYLFKSFFSLFNSFDNKKEFILSNYIVKRHVQANSIILDDKFINLLASHISLLYFKSNQYILTVKTINPKLSVDILNAYIIFIEKKLTHDVFDKLKITAIADNYLADYEVFDSNRVGNSFESFLNSIIFIERIKPKRVTLVTSPLKIEMINFSKKSERPINNLIPQKIFINSLFMIFGLMLGICSVLIKDVVNNKK